MADAIKFTEDELKSLSDTQQTYQSIQTAMGQVSVAKMVLDQQMEQNEKAHQEVVEEWKKAQENERELVKQLNDKYGPGTLNPETGEFTPAPQPEGEAEVASEG